MLKSVEVVNGASKSEHDCVVLVTNSHFHMPTWPTTKAKKIRQATRKRRELPIGDVPLVVVEKQHYRWWW